MPLKKSGSLDKMMGWENCIFTLIKSKRMTSCVCNYWGTTTHIFKEYLLEFIYWFKKLHVVQRMPLSKDPSIRGRWCVILILSKSCRKNCGSHLHQNASVVSKLDRYWYNLDCLRFRTRKTKEEQIFFQMQDAIFSSPPPHPPKNNKLPSYKTTILPLES